MRAMIPGAALIIPWTTGIAWRIPLATEKIFPAVVAAPIALFAKEFELLSHAFDVIGAPAIYIFLDKKKYGHDTHGVHRQCVC